MTRTATTIVAAVLAASLAACSKPAQTSQNASPEPMPSMAMPGISGPSRSAPAQARTGEATGIVSAIDAAAGKITLDHGPVAKLQWPAMKMAFNAKAGQMKGIAVGDKVAFKFTVSGTSAEITEIRPR